MLRLVAILIVILLLFYLVYNFKRMQLAKQKQMIKYLCILILLIVLLVLTISGRLNWLLALLGAIIPLIPKFFSWILRLLPSLAMLLKSYRSMDGFNQHSAPNSNQQQAARPKFDVMDVKEAREVLSVKEGATRDEILQAYRNLMRKIHPDRGGSDYLAAKINQAKKILLEEIGKK